jgi:dipeptidyl aminopeptidase/acylaminoacyl peptidase
LTREAKSGVFFVENRDRADRKWTVSMLRPDGPLRYYLYDRDSGKLEFLFADRPKLADVKLAPVEFTHIRARDGMSLPAYLTAPVGVPRKGLPLVLYVHGGPWFRDDWFYDPTVQLLANRGCAVLQVQFRGSIGFGPKHLNASTRQWGAAMQDDLTDAVRWAIAEKIADPKRVAIVGGSYGGYATLAGLAFTPELYACGVDIVGPSNVATALAAFPSWWAPVKKRWVMRVGDAENDAELNRRISPLFHASSIRAPLLIGHGANDPRVKQSESDQIVAALRERKLPVTYVVYPDEGHGFGRTENALDFTARMEDFLAQHLGLRHEPLAPVRGTSAELR